MLVCDGLKRHYETGRQDKASGWQKLTESIHQSPPNNFPTPSHPHIQSINPHTRAMFSTTNPNLTHLHPQRTSEHVGLGTGSKFEDAVTGDDGGGWAQTLQHTYPSV